MDVSGRPFMSKIVSPVADASPQTIREQRLRECSPGDLEAVREDVARHFAALRDRVYWYLRRRDCSPLDAEEITQEAFLRLHRVLMEGTHIQDVLFWTLAVARRIATDRFRHRRYERPLLVELSRNLAETVPDDGPTCEDDLVERQRRQSLMRAIQNLTPLQRECLELRAKGHSLREVSGIVRVSQTSVSNAVQRAVQRLRRHLNV
jgi:RNA polymerase sigma-70 factor (ECF subfamily)